MAAGKSGSKSGAKAGSRNKSAKVVKSPPASLKLQVVDETMQVLNYISCEELVASCKKCTILSTYCCSLSGMSVLYFWSLF